MVIKEVDVENLMQVIQFQGMQDDALNANGYINLKKMFTSKVKNFQSNNIITT
jgi:hypothetical protein